jgi:hypothetical protein
MHSTNRIMAVAASVVALLCATTHAQVVIDPVTVGNSGNANDTEEQGYGGVGYERDRGLAPELVGGPVDLDTGVTSNLGGVSVAYNSTDDEYRVAWFDSRITGQNDVYAQRVSASGGLLGANVTIIAGSSSQTDTAIAHNPTTNEYLITWRNQSGSPGSPGFNHTYGGVASATGGLLGSEADYSNAGLEATLAYNSVDDEYLVEARNFAGGGTAGIYGRRISAAGSAVGGDIVISTSGAPAPAGQVAYNGSGNQYLATWRDQSASNLKARIINADGTFATTAFVISAMFPESGLAASVACDPVHDRYLAVFSEFSASGVYGQFVSSAGTLDGPVFTIVEPTTARLSPFVAYDGVNAVFLVAWVDNDSGGLTVQLLYDDGALAGDPLPIENPGSATGPPRIAANSTQGGFIVAWADHIWDTPGKHDILAQIIGVTSEMACPNPGDSGNYCTADVYPNNGDGVWDPNDDGDCIIDLSDLGELLPNYGATSGMTREDGDVYPVPDGDGAVDISDLGELLAQYGDNCN